MCDVYERGGGDYGVNSNMRFEFIQNGPKHRVVTRNRLVPGDQASG